MSFSIAFMQVSTQAHSEGEPSAAGRVKTKPYPQLPMAQTIFGICHLLQEEKIHRGEGGTSFLIYMHSYT